MREMNEKIILEKEYYKRKLDVNRQQSVNSSMIGRNERASSSNALYHKDYSHSLTQSIPVRESPSNPLLITNENQKLNKLINDYK